MNSIYSEVSESGEPKLAFIQGSQGVGKSTLASWFVKQKEIEENKTILIPIETSTSFGGLNFKKFYGECMQILIQSKNLYWLGYKTAVKMLELYEKEVNDEFETILETLHLTSSNYLQLKNNPMIIGKLTSHDKHFPKAFLSIFQKNINYIYDKLPVIDLELFSLIWNCIFPSSHAISIKASLLNTANNITENELLEGQGIVDFEAALNSIISANIGNDNVHQLVGLTPKVGPIEYLTSVPQGMKINVPLTLITSHPNEVTISFTGGLNGITTHSSIKNSYSQALEIQINTNSVSPGSTLTGNVTAILNGTTSVTQIKIEIGGPLKGKIGLDLGHTYWDDLGVNGIGSSKTGEMIRLAMLNGYSVEHVTEKVNETILNKFDIFWMADPMNLMEANSPSLSEQGFQENVLYDSEIIDIVNFVNNGGSLLVDFNGFMNSSDNLSEEVLIGLNATGINQLISNFGIEASIIPIEERIGQETVDLINQSSLVRNAGKFTHLGNYLQINEDAQPLAVTAGGKITAATYNDPTSGGRVMVTSSNYWLDNIGVLGLYNGAGIDNRILAENTIKWLNQESRVIKIFEHTTSDTISGSFVAFENGSISTKVPEIYVEANDFINFEKIELTDHLNGTYSFTHAYSGQGIIRIIAELGTDYIVWELIIDTVGPTIFPRDTNPNGTRFDEATLYIIDFVVQDDIADVNPSSAIIFIENTMVSADTSYSEGSSILSVLLNAEDFQNKKLGEFYKLQISISDKNDNTSIYVYYFQIGQPANSIETITTVSSSNLSNGNSNNIFENLNVLIISILILIIFGLGYKNYILSKRKTEYL